MAEVTVATINDLRQRTNAGMMDCKKALIETNGDMDAAIKILREKGLAIQVKRADKESKEGIIKAVIAADGNTIALAEVNTETDFVAKTDNFKNFVAAVAQKVMEKGEDIGDSMRNELLTIISQTGENVKVRRTARYELSGTGKIESYIHMGGKVGVIVEVACGKAETASHATFVELVHDLALQIAAAAPRYLVSEEVPADVVEAEKDIYRNQLAEQKKPANIIENILKGKIQKFYSDICLVHQAFVKEPKLSITDIVNACAKATGDTVTIKRFVRFQLGV
ncbi:MAG: translation elongation factor Ts [bacterium]